jgi:hypothetical protein
MGTSTRFKLKFNIALSTLIAALSFDLFLIANPGAKTYRLPSTRLIAMSGISPAASRYLGEAKNEMRSVELIARARIMSPDKSKYALNASDIRLGVSGSSCWLYTSGVKAREKPIITTPTTAANRYATPYVPTASRPTRDLRQKRSTKSEESTDIDPITSGVENLSIARRVGRSMLRL